MNFTKDDVKRVVWTFVQAFVIVFAAGIGDLVNAFKSGGLDAAQAAIVALICAAGAAGISALKNLLLADGSALK